MRAISHPMCECGESSTLGMTLFIMRSAMDLKFGQGVCCTPEGDTDLAWTQRMLREVSGVSSLRHLCHALRKGESPFQNPLRASDLLYVTGTFVLVFVVGLLINLAIVLLATVKLVPIALRAQAMLVVEFFAVRSKQNPLWFHALLVPAFVSGVLVIPFLYAVLTVLACVLRATYAQYKGTKFALLNKSLRAGIVSLYQPLHKLDVITNRFLIQGTVPYIGESNHQVCHLFKHMSQDPSAPRSDCEDVSPVVSSVNSADSESLWLSRNQREARRLMLDLVLALGEAGLWVGGFCLFSLFFVHDVAENW